MNELVHFIMRRCLKEQEFQTSKQLERKDLVVAPTAARQEPGYVFIVLYI